jgi:pyridoxamine 5'-phosphate oxidase
MNKNDVFEAINRNPVFYLATMDGRQPRVRGMLLYRAGDDGIIFHTAKIKDLCSQIMKNNNVEMCFNADGTQIRISGKLEPVENIALKDQIADHPTRAFLTPWRSKISVEEFHKQFAVFKMAEGHITLWTMEKNLEPKVELEF